MGIVRGGLYMITTRLGLPVLMSLGLVGVIDLPTRADPILERGVPLVLAETSLAQASFVTHTEPDAFAIQYPQGWQVDSLGEDTIEIVSGPNGDPTMDIHTQVQLLREDPDAVINRSIDQFIADQAEVGRYLVANVDNQPAFRIWMSASDEVKIISTFVGYGDLQTAVLTSQYSPSNADAEAMILQVHDSFVNTGVATAAE
ncbi:MAG: hypothetical protein AAGF01_32710 [Cyanobacteria bacterium P01_G01_bin.38]